MEQEDRDMLIRMDVRQETQLKMLEQHIKDSKEFHVEYIGKLQNHNDRLLIIEQKTKPLIFKFFAGIGAFLGIK